MWLRDAHNASSSSVPTPLWHLSAILAVLYELSSYDNYAMHMREQYIL